MSEVILGPEQTEMEGDRRLAERTEHSAIRLESQSTHIGPSIRHRFCLNRRSDCRCLQSVPEPQGVGSFAVWTSCIKEGIGALDVVEEILNSQTFAWDLKPLFRLQMAYLLLWSSIERYVSLRYHLGKNVKKKVDQLSGEQAFASSLLFHVRERQEVYRADRPSQKEVLDPQSPEKALKYFYQLRSNVTHRGKAVIRDHDRMRDSLAQLLPIFRDVLRVAQSDANMSKRSGSVIPLDI
ncbi:MAG TPA: hypothetical protein VHZ55_21965 [Bryobacteraceae bacterium]|jgi:hypothetical protein|nr:hypothetical protein [Bryobacteraceae bacterium]